MYVDAETYKTAPQAASSSQLEQTPSQGVTEPQAASPRKRKKRSRKGKERAVEANEEDAMDTT